MPDCTEELYRRAQVRDTSHTALGCNMHVLSSVSWGGGGFDVMIPDARGEIDLKINWSQLFYFTRGEGRGRVAYISYIAVCLDAIFLLTTCLYFVVLCFTGKLSLRHEYKKI